jgi:cell division protein FtsB
MNRPERARPGRPGPLGSKLLTAGAVFLLAVLLITSLFGKKGLLESQRARKTYETRLEERARLESRKARLLKEIEELERNPRAVEREAREKLWLMKKDEVVVVKTK